MSGTEQRPLFSLGPYVLQTLLLLIAPTLYAASIYMALGRIIIATDGEAYCWIRRKWLTKTFLLGDIISFVMQGAGMYKLHRLGEIRVQLISLLSTGGGIMTSGTLSAVTTGENIIIVGLVVQLIFFSAFMYTSVRFHLGMRKGLSRKVLHNQPPWERHIHALYAASLLIFVRCAFRLVEYAQGNDGYLVSHEAYLYIFDALLMALTMAVFAWVHPSEINAIINPGNKVVRGVIRIVPAAGERLRY